MKTKILCSSAALSLSLVFGCSSVFALSFGVSVGPDTPYVYANYAPIQWGTATASAGKSSASVSNITSGNPSLKASAYDGGRAQTQYANTYYVDMDQQYPGYTPSFNMHLSGMLRVRWPTWDVYYSGSYNNFLTQSEIYAGIGTSSYDVYLQSSPWSSNGAVAGYGTYHNLHTPGLPTPTKVNQSPLPLYPYGYSYINLNSNLMYEMENYVVGTEEDYLFYLGVQTGVASNPWFTFVLDTGGLIRADFSGTFEMDLSQPIVLFSAQLDEVIPLPVGSVFQLGSDMDKVIITDYGDDGGYITETYIPGDDNGNGNGDQTPIPEPTTMLLLGTGLVGVAGAARRKKRNQA